MRLDPGREIGSIKRLSGAVSLLRDRSGLGGCGRGFPDTRRNTPLGHRALEMAVQIVRRRAAGRSRFLLTAPPLRLPGAVGSPVTPIATV